MASKESLLTQAGFLLLPPQNPKQTKMFKSLPPGKISTLTSPSGKTLYVMPDATGSKAYVGKQTQYDKYRALRGSQSITDQESIIKTQEMEMNDFGSGILEGIQ